MPAAALDQALPLVGVAAGVLGLVFTALKFQRDQAGALVAQQHTIFEELGETADRLRAERDDCAEKLVELEEELARTQNRVRVLEGVATDLEKQVDALVERLAQALERRGGPHAS